MARHAAATRLYIPDDPAGDIRVVALGRLEHVLDPEVEL